MQNIFIRYWNGSGRNVC